MLDPSDRLLETFREGDADVNPITSAGEFGQIPVTNMGPAEDHPSSMFRFRRWVSAAAIGDQVTFDAGSRPDYWKVAVDDDANVEVAVYDGEGPFGVGIPLGQNGRATIPAQTQQLTLVNLTANVASVTLVGLRGHLVICEVVFRG